MSQIRFSIIPGWIVTDPRLKGRDLQVLCVLGRHTDKQGWCTRSQVKMAAEMDCARSTVQAAIDRLVDIGVVEKHVRESADGRDSAHFYRVIFDRPPPSGYAFDAWADEEGEENILSGQDDGSTPPADISAPPADPRPAPPAGSEPAPINASHLTPPAERQERENALARGDDGDGKENHDDPKSLLRRVKALEIGRHDNPWPGTLGSSTDWAVKQFAKLAEDERRMAEDRRDPYLAICKAQGVKPVALGVFLRDRKFLDVTRQAAKAATQKLERVAIKPFGPVWGGMRAYALGRGPVSVDMPGDIRGEAEQTHEALMRVSEARARSWRDRKNIGINVDGRLLFPEDFDREELRRRQCDSGYPVVNHLHKLASERGSELTDGKHQHLADLCEPVPVGSPAYEAWRVFHGRMNWLLWPDPGTMPVVYFPKGGPDGFEDFMAAARAAMSEHEGGRGDAHAA